jgi:predicted  nucleic acid-binding Zn-ribbon protein
MSQIWVVLAKMKERDVRMDALENENRRLKQGMEELQERLALLETQKDDERRVESQTAENAAELVNIDLELMEIRQDVDELKMKADAVERGELVDTVKNDVLEYMRIRLWGDG